MHPKRYIRGAEWLTVILERTIRQHFINKSFQISLKIVFCFCNEEILNQEVTSQGNPLAMLMYSIGIPPLIKTLNSQD